MNSSECNNCTLSQVLLGLVSCVGAIANLTTPVFAQVVADPSLGTTVNQQDSIYQITGGTTVGGTNLFHSFSRFDIPDGGIADFLNDPALVNIFSRVTDGTPSDIQGLIRTQGNANLFLMNPSGIIFGRNARLNIGGSFVATTAEAIKFADGQQFPAISSQTTPLLTISVPLGLQFGTNPGKIQVQGSGHNLIYSDTGSTIRSDVPGLQVQPQKTLALVGGDVILEGGNLRAESGRIELGSVAAAGLVSLAQNDSGFALGYSDVQKFGNIQLSQKALADVSGESGGDIQVQSGQLSLRDGATILSITQGAKSGGSLTINAKDSVELMGGSVDNQYASSFSTEAQGHGSTGEMKINTAKLILTDGAYIQNYSFAEGNGGNLTVQASDYVDLRGSSLYRSGLYTGSVSGGNAGNLTISTGNLIVRDGALVTSSTSAQGNAGTLLVQARDSVSLSNRAFIEASTYGEGKAKNLTIETGRLSVSGGSEVSTSTYSASEQGNAGNLIIQARDLVEVVGTDALGNSSLLVAQVNTDAKGQGGDLTIDTKRLSVRDGGQVSASTSGLGKAGNLTVHASESVELSGEDTSGANKENPLFPGGLFAQVNITRTGQQGKGPGGQLTIETGHLKVSDGSKVQVSTFGGGNSGNLFIHATDVEVFETPKYNYFSTGIFAEVADPSPDATGIPGDPGRIAKGNGGNLTIEAERLSIRDGGRVSVSTLNQGNAGKLFVRAKDFVEVVGTDARFGESRLTASVAPRGRGTGGDLTIETRHLSVKDGGRVSVSTLGQGNAGALQIHAHESVEVIGTSPDSQLKSQLSAAVGQNSTGSGGRLTVEAESMTIRDGGIITSRSEGQKSAGNITLNVNRTLQANNGDISTSSTQSSGGAIDITARDIRLQNDSDITTNVFNGTGGGGNIYLTANSIIALDDSDILAFARDGKGGDITLNTPAFFGYRYQPISIGTDSATLDGNNRVDIDASGAVSGIIILPDTSFVQNGLTELPQNPIDTNALIANSCIARSSRQEGTFTITGSGGLPYRPGDAPISPYPTGTIQRVKPNTFTLWKKGDRIVEPTGVYRLGNGRLVMSRECL